MIRWLGPAQAPLLRCSGRCRRHCSARRTSMSASSLRSTTASVREKRLFLSHFDRLNTINLPRQARDKHSILGNNLMLRDKAWCFLSACMQGSPISTCCARSRRWASVWWFSSGRSSAAASREGSPAARRRAACCDDGDRRDKKEPRGKS